MFAGMVSMHEPYLIIYCSVFVLYKLFLCHIVIFHELPLCQSQMGIYLVRCQGRSQSLYVDLH